MNIQAEKIEIGRLILETNNPGILESVKSIFKKSVNTDFGKLFMKYVSIREIRIFNSLYLSFDIQDNKAWKLQRNIKF